MYIFAVWKEGSGFFNIGSLPCTCKCMLPSACGSESHFSGLVVGVWYRRYQCGMKKSYNIYFIPCQRYAGVTNRKRSELRILISMH